MSVEYAPEVGPSRVPPFDYVACTWCRPPFEAIEEHVLPRDGVADAVCRIVARGRIVARLVEGGGGQYMVRAFVVEDPTLAGDLRALVFVGEYGMRIWHGPEWAAREVLASGSAFNFA